MSGRPLQLENDCILTDGAERWPVIDGIPYLRTGRAELVTELVAHLDRGRREDALVLLLADGDDWWDGPRPAEADLRRLVRQRDELSLRDAMALLAFGRVGDYFAQRWSDPTYLAGLALLDAHWQTPKSAFELACGIGHYLRDLARCGVRVSGSDVVFAKLWLARHWVAPDANLICFDAGSLWPLNQTRYDLCLCQDAFYFLEPKDEILARMRLLITPGGSLAVGHVHNREAENLSAGAGLTAAEIHALFPGATVYDDHELTRAAAAGRAPVPSRPSALARADAFSLVEGGTETPHPANGPLCRAVDEPGLRPNPLYVLAGAELAIAWPSERYRAEYAPRATYRLRIPSALQPDAGAIRRREFLDLPARW